MSQSQAAKRKIISINTLFAISHTKVKSVYRIATAIEKLNARTLLI